MNLVKRIENYVQDYVTLADPQYSLPIALWIIGTYCYLDFDAFPYLVITSSTKRSGKTRLSEMIGFSSSNPRNFAALTGPMLYRSIEDEKPTIVFDEAELLSSERAGTMRSILNVGYRRGQTVPRMSASGGIHEFQTYCPKLFVLIGDVFDTLRDRSIIITMKRAETRKRFTFDAVKEEGAVLRELISEAVKAHTCDIQTAFTRHKGLPFLMDRDEEIWTSLFCICQVFCKDRIEELQAAASDMAAEKTGEGRRYMDMRSAEEAATKDEYAKRALSDLWGILVKSNVKVIRTEDAIEGMKALPTAPWRKYKGVGIDALELSNLLNTFRLAPKRIAIGSGRGNQRFYRGYKRVDVERAMLAL